ncbi:hypothetical protein KP509_13G022300 [Ceratopteris richardii]|uniref:Protodermal factor 1 n=1 Tax=Ceratopteris richardii TaxID=49495 RepID=A0A8T2TG32_CERRI|nr:hypothetical protein KP509_13G022300 [Ceratopteris richardii]
MASSSVLLSLLVFAIACGQIRLVNGRAKFRQLHYYQPPYDSQGGGASYAPPDSGSSPTGSSPCPPPPYGSPSGSSPSPVHHQGSSGSGGYGKGKHRHSKYHHSSHHAKRSTGYSKPPSSGSSPVQMPPSPSYSTPPSSGSSPISEPPPSYGGTPPSSGGSPVQVPPTPIVDTPPSPLVDTPPSYSSPPYDSGNTPSGSSPIDQPPSSLSPPDVGSPLSSPLVGSPLTPVTGTPPSYGGGSCDFWKKHITRLRGILSGIGTLLQLFGGRAGSIFGSGMTVEDALNNSNTDGYSQLAKHGIAAFLNSLTIAGFEYTPFEVRQRFTNALDTPESAMQQAYVFEQANLRV